MIATLNTGPPRRGASAVTSRGKRETHQASDQTSHGIDTRKGRYRQLDRFCGPLVAVWKALDWREWEALRQQSLQGGEVHRG
jgi:hypothetical protein